MKYAFVADQKTTPRPGLRGYCIHCSNEMIAKCGKIKIWHWAHKTMDVCDSWWENESRWHRAWKDRFPESYQEVTHFNSITGERHIADVKNEYGLVIEFQHSTMTVDERDSREAFYQDMAWVVDGTCGAHDWTYFNIGTSGPIQKNPLLYSVKWWGQSRLLHFWAESSKTVYLDFGSKVLWRLVSFNPITRMGVVGLTAMSLCVEDCLSGSDMRWAFIDEDQDLEEFRMPRPLIEVTLSEGDRSKY